MNKKCSHERVSRGKCWDDMSERCMAKKYHEFAFFRLPYTIWPLVNMLRMQIILSAENIQSILILFFYRFFRIFIVQAVADSGNGALKAE